MGIFFIFSLASLSENTGDKSSDINTHYIETFQLTQKNTEKYILILLEKKGKCYLHFSDLCALSIGG